MAKDPTPKNTTTVSGQNIAPAPQPPQKTNKKPQEPPQEPKEG